MDPLATLDDYTARFGTPPSEERTQALLADASSWAREVAGMSISEETETFVIDGNGTCHAQLPEDHVTSVTGVTVDGTALASSDYEWWEDGALVRVNGVWPAKPRVITGTYSHGLDPVPEWVIGLICAMARSADTDTATDISSERLGDHQITYVASRSTGGVMRLPSSEESRLAGLRIAAIA